MHKEQAELATSCDETDWAARISYVTARAREVFGGRPGYSGEWLCTPSPALEGETPLEALGSERGFAAVRELLTKIENGIYT